MNGLTKDEGWHGFRVPWSATATSAKMVRRAFVLSNTNATWPVKWGNQWDICYEGGLMLHTGLSVLYLLTYQEWVELSIKLYNQYHGL